jgi:hypothetical protein
VLVVGAFVEVGEFVDDDVFEAQWVLLGQFRVDPDGA